MYVNLFLPSDNVKVVPIAMDFFGRMSKAGLEFIQYTVKQIVQAPEPSENRFSTDGDSNILLGKMMRIFFGLRVRPAVATTVGAVRSVEHRLCQ
jgi:hypothetical protein